MKKKVSLKVPNCPKCGSKLELFDSEVDRMNGMNFLDVWGCSRCKEEVYAVKLTVDGSKYIKY